MTSTDTEFLNAFLDGELSDAEEAMIKHRLHAEPALQAGFERLQAVKSALSSLTLEELAVDIPSQLEPIPAAANTDGRPRAKMLLTAACIALLVGVSALFLYPTSQPKDLMAWHSELVGQAYEVETQDTNIRQVTSRSIAGMRVPDLTASNLYFVDAVTVDDESGDRSFLLHYSGLSGCRLTFWIDATEADGVEAEPNIHRWTVGGQHYAIIATRMDANRFKTIAAYVVQKTKLRTRRPGLRTAMANAYRDALPCA